MSHLLLITFLKLLNYNLSFSVISIFQNVHISIGTIASEGGIGEIEARGAAVGSGRAHSERRLLLANGFHGPWP